MKLSRIGVFLVIIALAGCVSMESVMSSWVGNSIDDATAAWGAPDSRMARNDGGGTYTWTVRTSDKYGIHECRRTLVTNSSERIVSWAYNGCPKFVRK